jgi:hypothetical protein
MMKAGQIEKTNDRDYEVEERYVWRRRRGEEGRE